MAGVGSSAGASTQQVVMVEVLYKMAALLSSLGRWAPLFLIGQRASSLGLFTMSGLSEGLLEKGYWQPAREVVRAPILTRATKYVVDLLRPAVLNKPNGRDAPIRRTAYLDGLRGFAAFLVYWQHHELWAHDKSEIVFENAYGYEGRYYFTQIPALRLLFSGGHFAVTVFFVLSGYVLSTKPLSLIQAGDYLKLGDNLSSALFRRWLRLHIPLIVTTFLYLTFFHFVWSPAWPDAMGSYRDELWNWYCELKNFTFIFRTGGNPWFGYNFHSWSIPVEFKGSIVIYTSLLAFSRCTRNTRLWCHIGLFVYFMYIVDGWYCALFVSGMLLADLDLLAADNNLPEVFNRMEKYKKYIFTSLFAASIWLGGCPSHSAEVDVMRRSPGWYYLSYLKPQAVYDYKWFYLFWASTFLVASIQRLPFLKSFFETRFNQYMGRISFAFYLVHGPILWTFGERLYSAAGLIRESSMDKVPGWVNYWPMSTKGPFGMEVAFIAPHIFLLPVTFWLAEIVTKLVDEPSVRFAQWLYAKTLAPAIKL